MGLNTSIANQVEFQSYSSFDEVCTLVAKVECQQKEAKVRSCTFSFQSNGKSFTSQAKVDS